MRILLTISLLLAAVCCSAQQDNQFTQFAHTKLHYNPGVAGTDDNLAIIGRHRNQWSGIDGAPQGQTLLVEFPTVYKALGFGIAVNRSTVGIQEKNDLTGIYSYKVRLQNATVSLGMQFSFRQYINDFSRPGLIAIDGFEKDPSLTQERFTKNLFNLGMGLYLNSPKYYLGIAVPRVVKSEIDASKDNLSSTEVRHLYGMFGLRFTLGAKWNIEPNLLFKKAELAPYDLDIQNTFIYQEQVHLGLNLRAGGSQRSLMESFAFLIGFQFTPTIFASMSYDFNTTNIRQYEEGSFEILLAYRVAKDRSPKKIQNPRYY